MRLIVAVDENWGIGKNNDLLCRISADMQYFRKMTTGHTLVLGRKTLESFPNKKPLPNRNHIVLTKNIDYQAEGVTLCNSIEQLQQLLQSYHTNDIFVIGGGSIYTQLLPYCDTAYVTHIQKSFDADTHFPNLDNHPDWVLTQKGVTQQENNIAFSFDIYTKK